MTDYTWAFDKSFLVFLIIAFVSLTIAVKVKSILPMPLIYGLIFAAGFGTGILPTDMLLSANMIAVGTIAFNVLVIHSGTMINLPLIKTKKKETAICIIASIVMVLVVGFGLSPILGKGLAFLAPGSVIGGGASCAIASRWVLDKNPQISVFPWLIFMFQGLFSVPVVTWALKKEGKCLLEKFRADRCNGDTKNHQPSDIPLNMKAPNNGQPNRKKTFCERIPSKYKNPAYYLGIIMLVTVVNNLLQNTLLAGLQINPNVTALLLGFLLGGIGLMDRAPLFKSDSYGLLLLGLMGLMANTISKCPWQGLVAFLPALLLVFVVSTAVLVLCGILGAKYFHFSPYRGIALTMNCMMGFPVNDMLTNNAAASGETEEEKAYLKSQISPILSLGTMLISNAVSVLIVSLMVILI